MRIAHPELAHATSISHAESIQEEIRARVRVVPVTRRPHRVGGCDVAYTVDESQGFAAAVALDFETLRKIEGHAAHRHCSFEYIPGLFAFREVPILLEALKLLSEPPDLLLVEGHGIAHPRRAGLASHLGVILDIPTIGCAKTPLGGVWKEPPPVSGSWSEIRMEEQTVGFAYRARRDGALVFVSPGHLVDVPSVSRILPSLFGVHRLPEPLHLAHEASVKARKKH